MRGRVTGDGLADAAAAHDAMCQARMPRTRGLTDAELNVMAERLEAIQRGAAAQHGAIYRSYTDEHDGSEVTPLGDGPRWEMALVWLLLIGAMVGVVFVAVAVAVSLFT